MVLVLLFVLLQVTVEVTKMMRTEGGPDDEECDD